MASTTPITFICFPKLPLELQKMIWEAAAADLPVLDIQRFTAEITLTQRNAHDDKPQRPLLCFTPHEDFIDLTTGHRGLLRACRESRKPAQKQSDCLLPIQYLTTDDTGSLVTRRASMPFNPSGGFWVGGLSLAVKAATEGRGARGSKLLHSHSAAYIITHVEILDEATSLVKNLVIDLEPQSEFDDRRDMIRWHYQACDLIASNMPNSNAVGLAPRRRRSCRIARLDSHAPTRRRGS